MIINNLNHYIHITMDNDEIKNLIKEYLSNKLNITINNMNIHHIGYTDQNYIFKINTQIYVDTNEK